MSTDSVQFSDSMTCSAIKLMIYPSFTFNCSFESGTSGLYQGTSYCVSQKFFQDIRSGLKILCNLAGFPVHNKVKTEWIWYTYHELNINWRNWRILLQYLEDRTWYKISTTNREVLQLPISNILTFLQLRTTVHGNLIEVSVSLVQLFWIDSWKSVEGSLFFTRCIFIHRFLESSARLIIHPLLTIHPNMIQL